MKRFLIEDLSEIAYMMYNGIVENGFKDVMFVGLYDDAATVLKYLLMFDEVTPYYINFKPEDWDGYDREYYVTLDADMNIWCEEAYNFEHEYYLGTETECLFVADDCNSALLKEVGCDADNMYEVSYDLDDEETDCECNDTHEVITHVATDDTGKLRGFEKTWKTHEDGLHYHSTYSFFSSNEDILKNMLENFSIKY